MSSVGVWNGAVQTHIVACCKLSTTTASLAPATHTHPPTHCSRCSCSHTNTHPPITAQGVRIATPTPTHHSLLKLKVFMLATHTPSPHSLLKVFVQAVVQHDAEGRVGAGLELKAHNLAHSLPVAVPDARVAECLQQRQMLLELVQFHLEEFRGALWFGLLSKCPGEFVHSPPHVPHVVLHLLSVQLQEGTWWCVCVCVCVCGGGGGGKLVLASYTRRQSSET